ncbi:MAG: mechanosensitive ion channel family protein [Pseudonocardia sp.]
MTDLLPATPACLADQGSWCSVVYGWTHNDLLSRWADRLVDTGLSVLLIVLLAALARSLLHRAIGRLVRGAANGRLRVVGVLRRRLPGSVRRRAPAGLREMAGPMLSERRGQRANTIGSVLRSVASVAVLAVASIMVLAEFGLNPGPVLASAGIVGVALGFGAQNLVRDFLSGMFMLLEDQYGVGDIVDLGEASGTVEAVGLRITTLRDFDGTVWHVRNGEILRVGNKSQGFAVAVVDLPLAHSADIAEAQEIAGRVAAEVAGSPEIAPDLLEAPQVLGVERVTVEGMTLRLTAKVSPGRQFAVQRAMHAAIADAFDDAGLPRPYPVPLSPSGAGSTAERKGGPR